MNSPSTTSTDSSAVPAEALPGSAAETLENASPPPPKPPRLARTRARWDGVPLRVRLVAILVALLIVALTLTGLTTTFVLRHYLIGKLDDQLTSSVADVISDASGPSGRKGGPLSTYAAQITYDSGMRPEPDAPTDRPNPAFTSMTRAQALATNREPFTIGAVSGDEKWRVLAVAVPSTNGDTMVAFRSQESGSIQIALPLDGVQDAVHRLRVLVFAFGLLVTAICALLGWLAIRRAFVPLTEVEETAAAIAAGDLSKRIPEHPASTEVGRLTSSLNGMLAQIESAFRSREASEQRTRRFAADASHELRTPLASIRGFAELYRQGAVREPDDVARTMSRIEDESRRMGTLVEDLLLLARLDEQRPSRSDPVDLAVLAGDATHDARGLAPDRQVRLVGLHAGRGPEAAMVIGDDNRLRQVVANLVGNAVRHTPTGTPVEVAVGTDGGRSIIEVRDHGPGLAPEHAGKVFERFYRVDSSRARTQGGGSGLGLSIVTAVVTAHGGRVGVTQTPGGGATFRVELPPAPVSNTPEPEDEDDEDPA